MTNGGLYHYLPTVATQPIVHRWNVAVVAKVAGDAVLTVFTVMTVDTRSAMGVSGASPRDQTHGISVPMRGGTVRSTCLPSARTEEDCQLIVTCLSLVRYLSVGTIGARSLNGSEVASKRTTGDSNTGREW